jgi:hypothetical protein
MYIASTAEWNYELYQNCCKQRSRPVKDTQPQVMHQESLCIHIVSHSTIPSVYVRHSVTAQKNTSLPVSRVNMQNLHRL